MHGQRYTFPKKERLCRKKIINQLVSGEGAGKISVYPLLMVYQITPLPEKVPAQVVFGVSRRFFKKAVNRNYIKRILRESYRKNKQLIYSTLQQYHVQAAILIVYTADKILKYQELNTSMVRIFEKFNQHIV